MTPATFDDTTVDIAAADYLFRAKGSVPKFAGLAGGLRPGHDGSRGERTHRAAGAGAPARDRCATTMTGSGVLPALTEGQTLDRAGASRPSRSSRSRRRASTKVRSSRRSKRTASAGPSTYASIISVLQARDYVNKTRGPLPPDDPRPPARRQAAAPGVRRHPRRRVHGADGRPARSRSRRARPTTRTRSRLLQEVREGPEARRRRRCPTSRKGSRPARSATSAAQGEMVEKAGKFGIFLACSRYPGLRQHQGARAGRSRDRRTRRDVRELRQADGRSSAAASACSWPAPAIPSARRRARSSRPSRASSAAKPDQILDEMCPNCGKNLVIKQGRFGEFTACTGYPECKYIKHKSTGVALPEGRRRHRRAQVDAAARCSTAA